MKKNNRFFDENVVITRNDGLFIPSHQLSLGIACLLFLFFTTFIVGYFWGKSSATDKFIQKVDQESFADQIYASLCALHDQDIYQEEESVTIATQEKQEEVPIEVCHDQPKYFAQLIGFGTEQAAQKFVQRVCTKFMPVIIKKRISRTARGKKITWYQVVTEPTSDKELLQKQVDQLAKFERLRDTRIISA